MTAKTIANIIMFIVGIVVLAAIYSSGANPTITGFAAFGGALMMPFISSWRKSA